MRQLEYKNLSFKIENADLQESMFEGYASVFGNKDSQGDIIERGAFTKTLTESRDRVKVLWQHNIFEPIGRPVEMREDDLGLYIKAKISETDTGKKALTLARDGVVNEMSIGYDVVKDDFDRSRDARILKEIRLFEVSLVTFAANPMALVTGVKSMEELERLLEKSQQEIKEGRVLSSRNTEKVRAAIEALQALLAASEPLTDTRSGQEPLHSKDPDEAEVQSVLEHIKNLRGEK